MAEDKRISDVSEVTTLENDDQFVIVRGTQNYRVRNKNINKPKIFNFTDAGTFAVVHNFGRTPDVVVRDSAGKSLNAKIVHNSNNQFTISISPVLSGYVEYK